MDEPTPDPRLVTSKDRKVLIEQAHITMDHLFPICIKISETLADLAEQKAAAALEYETLQRRSFLEYEAVEFQTTANTLTRGMAVLRNEIKSWTTDEKRLLTPIAIELNLINELDVNIRAGQMVIQRILGITYAPDQLLDLIFDSLKRINTLIL